MQLVIIVITAIQYSADSMTLQFHLITLNSFTVH